MRINADGLPVEKAGGRDLFRVRLRHLAEGCAAESGLRRGGCHSEPQSRIIFLTYSGLGCFEKAVFNLRKMMQHELKNELKRDCEDDENRGILAERTFRGETELLNRRIY